MTPLRITIELVDPVAPGAFPALLDGLLASCAVEDALLMATDEHDPTPVRELGRNLPLAVFGGSEHKVWQASAFMPVGRVTSDGGLDMLSQSGPTHSRQLTSRPDYDDMAQGYASGFIQGRVFDRANPAPYAFIINIQSGPMKATRITYSLKNVMAVEAWCVGDAASIEALLLHVSYFGSKRRLGHGKVRRISVVEDARAVSLCRLRPLPEDLLNVVELPACDQRVEVATPLEAPYWDTKFSMTQFAPTAMYW